MDVSKLFFPLIYLFATVLLSAQTGGPNGELGKRNQSPLLLQSMQKDSLYLWQEKVSLQLNDLVVQPKDHLFFKAYVLTGPKQLRVSASNVLKVELLDGAGKLVKHQYHKVTAGETAGSFEVPKQVKPGTYYVRAYTKWMLNYGPDKFALQPIEVTRTSTAANAKPYVQNELEFFPEGGALISGLTAKMAMTGLSRIQGQAKIIDQNGIEVANVTRYGEDFGTAIFVPNRDGQYAVVDATSQSFPLPEVQAIGYSLMSNNIGDDDSHVRIEVSPELRNEKIYLKGISNGITYFEKEIEFGTGLGIEVEIPKKGIPNGILELRLVDDFDQLWATRPVLIENNDFVIDMEAIETSAAGKAFKIKVTDNEGLPVETRLSLGVNAFENEGNDAMFSNNLRSDKFIKDLKVLTKGFLNEKVIATNDELPSEIYYDFQEGLEFYGQAYDLNNKLLSNTKIQLLVATEGDAIAKEAITDDSGMFKISNLQIEGEADIVFRTVAEETRGKMVKVIPFEFEVPPISESNTSKEQRLNARKRANYDRHVLNKEEAKRLIPLEGVTLKEEKIQKRSMPAVYGIKGRQGRVVVQDPKRPRLISELLLGIPGVIVSGDVNNPNVQLLSGSAGRIGSGSNSAGFSTLDQSGPLWVIDGFTIENSPFFSSGWGITANDIDRIEYIAPYNSDTSMWGTRGRWGVFLVYTRNGSEIDYWNRKQAQLTFQGYHNSIDFDTYRNELPNRKKENSRVLYWNPSLSTDENGEAIVRLNNVNATDKIKIEATAIRQDGKLGKRTKIF